MRTQSTTLWPLPRRSESSPGLQEEEDRVKGQGMLFVLVCLTNLTYVWPMVCLCIDFLISSHQHIFSLLISSMFPSVIDTHYLTAVSTPPHFLTLFFCSVELPPQQPVLQVVFRAIQVRVQTPFLHPEGRNRRGRKELQRWWKKRMHYT